MNVRHIVGALAVLALATGCGGVTPSSVSTSSPATVPPTVVPPPPGDGGPFETRSACDQFGNRVYFYDGTRADSIAVVGQDPTCKRGAR